MVSLEQYVDLQEQMKNKETIKSLENVKAKLEDVVEEFQETYTKRDGRTFDDNTRLMVYDCVVNQVPTQNIPVLIKKSADLRNFNRGTPQDNYRANDERTRHNCRPAVC